MTLLLAGLLALSAAWPGIAGAQPPPLQIVCILDFNRLGDDASMDWLQRGLADMMIGTLSPSRPVSGCRARAAEEHLAGA